MEDKERIIQLQERIEFLTEDPAADFYAALRDGIKELTQAMKDGELNFDTKPNQRSILLLAEKADKVFAGLAKGRELIDDSPKEDVKKAAKIGKANAVAI